MIKVTRNAPKPVHPDVVIELSHDAAMSLMRLVGAIAPTSINKFISPKHTAGVKQTTAELYSDFLRAGLSYDIDEDTQDDTTK